MLHCLSHFTSVLFVLVGLLAPAAANSCQGKLEVQSGGEKYSLPAVGETADEKDAPLPVDAATLDTLETWRGFDWDADKKKYRYHFGAAARTSAAIVLTADSSAGEFAENLDRCAELLSGIVGAEQLRKTYVAVVCGAQSEYERAVDYAADFALTLTEDPIQREYLAGNWRVSAKRSPTFTCRSRRSSAASKATARSGHRSTK